MHLRKILKNQKRMIPGLYNFLSCFPVDVLCMGQWHEGYAWISMEALCFMYRCYLLSTLSSTQFPCCVAMFLFLYSFIFSSLLLSFTALTFSNNHPAYIFFWYLMCDYLEILQIYSLNETSMIIMYIEKI